MGVVTHFLPQHLYVYNLQGEKIIDHVLRFENLDEEFSQLMKYYAINVTLGKKSTNVRKSDSLLTTANLTQKTILMINKYFTDDFKLFNYTKVQSFNSSTVRKDNIN